MKSTFHTDDSVKIAVPQWEYEYSTTWMRVLHCWACIGVYLSEKSQILEKRWKASEPWSCKRRKCPRLPSARPHGNITWGSFRAINRMKTTVNWRTIVEVRFNRERCHTFDRSDFDGFDCKNLESMKQLEKLIGILWWNSSSIVVGSIIHVNSFYSKSDWNSFEKTWKGNSNWVEVPFSICY